MTCRHEEIRIIYTEEKSEHKDLARCLRCGKTAPLDEFTNKKEVEISLKIDEEILDKTKLFPDFEIAIKRLTRIGLQFHELEKKCRDIEYIKSLIREKKFPFEDGDIEGGLLIVKFAMLNKEDQEKILSQLKHD